MRSTTPGRLTRKRLRSGCDTPLPVLLLVGAGSNLMTSEI